MITLGSKPNLPKGMSDMIEFMSFLNNRKEVEKYVTDLKKYIEEAEKATLLVGKINDIDRLHAEADKKNRLLSTELSAISAKESDILAIAKEEAQKILIDAESQANKDKNYAKKLKDAAIQKEKELIDKTKDLKDLETRLNVTAKALEHRSSILQKQEAELDRKQKILAQL